MGLITSACRRKRNEYPGVDISSQRSEVTLRYHDIDVKKITLSELVVRGLTREQCFVFAISNERDDIFRELVDQAKILDSRGWIGEENEEHGVIGKESEVIDEGKTIHNFNELTSLLKDKDIHHGEELKNILFENPSGELIAYYIKAFPDIISSISHDLVNYMTTRHDSNIILGYDPSKYNVLSVIHEVIETMIIHHSFDLIFELLNKVLTNVNREYLYSEGFGKIFYSLRRE